jgi:predicted O-methyltransferase YrrM
MNKPERIQELLQNTYRMFYSTDDQGGTNRLMGLKMLIDDHVKPESVIAEIGSFAGSSSELFALHCANLHCVDAWDPYWEITQIEIVKEAEARFDEMAKNYPHITKIKSLSAIAADKYPDQTFDLVYIDAAHDRENVTKDILAWLPKVKDGGTIAGHDYKYNPYIQVYEVVNEIFGSSKSIQVYPDSSWAIKK